MEELRKATATPAKEVSSPDAFNLLQPGKVSAPLLYAQPAGWYSPRTCTVFDTPLDGLAKQCCGFLVCVCSHTQLCAPCSMIRAGADRC
jgi:hypothetical protein